MAKFSAIAPRTKLLRAWYGAREKRMAEIKAPVDPKKSEDKRNIPSGRRKEATIKTIFILLIKENPRRWKISANA